MKKNKNLPYIIGLTGLIGSGKSTVAALFKDLGIVVINTDVIAYDIMLPTGSAYSQVCSMFGNQILNKELHIDRKKLGELVFNNAEQLRDLENIVHPLIYVEVLQQIEQNKTQHYILLEVPLLFKAPRYLELIDRSLVVNCEYQRIVERVAKRSKLNIAQIDKILEKQVAIDEQLRLADDIINNHGDIKELRDNVHKLHCQYIKLS